eukprot:233232_1
MDKYSAFVIGLNNKFEFGLFGRIYNSKEFVELNQPKNSCISHIYCGHKYTIFTNDNHENVWCTGYNAHGSCGIGNKNNPVKQYEPIDYFNINKIKIKKICVTVNGLCTFWITDTNTVYGNGLNDNSQLGFGGNNKYDILTPTLINNLKNVIDVKSTDRYTIALCSKNSDKALIIIKHWSRNIKLPNDIINVMMTFCSENTVYTTNQNDSKSKWRDKWYNDEWKEINELTDKNIIKISCGIQHSLFLTLHGDLYCMGKNKRGQMGSTDKNWQCIRSPAMVNYFKINKIQIMEIKSGWGHNLVIDCNGKVYSFGYNLFGQCGHGTRNNDVLIPKIIEYFKNEKIVYIDCGHHHSLCKTINDNYYLFGSNYYNECITFDGISRVSQPFCIDKIIEEKFNHKRIKSICLGLQNTKIIVCNY